MKNPFSVQRNKCLYCGANPTNHAFTWISSTLGVAGTHFNERVMTSWLGRNAMYAVERLILAITGVWEFLHVIRWSDDVSKAPLDRARVLWDEANRRGIVMQHLLVFGAVSDIYRAKIDGKWRYFNGLPRLSGPDNPALAWIDDKAILKERLMRAGIPVPKGGSFTSYKKACELFETLTKPVITKPRLGSRGRHTTTFISDEQSLRQAFHVAKKMCRYVMVEEHIRGPVYRGTVIDGKVAGVLGGEPPNITGDGKHTIIELIRIKNEQKDSRIKDVPINDNLDEFLARQKYDRETILPAGLTMDVSEKIGVSYGGKSIEVTPDTHPSYIKYLEQAAKVVGDPLLGFDFITSDITKDPDTLQWGIIECNAVPFINLHHDPLIGKPVNVAGALWDMIEKDAK